jgi:inorganic pyrophosphatase
LKLLAPQAYDAYKDIDDVTKPLLKEIQDFVKTYSRRQGNRIKLAGVVGAKAAMRSVKKNLQAFRKDRHDKKRAAR